jgi:DNA replication licensing factor MCM7
MGQYEKTLGDEAGSLKLVSSIQKNAHHYLEILSRAVDKAMPEPRTQITWVVMLCIVKQKLTQPQIQR